MRQQASGVALIVGSIAGLLVMALHPTSGSIEGLVRERAVLVGTHSVGIAMMPVLFFGFVGVTERAKRADVLAPAALILFACATIAAAVAGTLNGLAAPAFAGRVGTQTGIREVAQMVLAYNYQLNAAFGEMFMLATSAALVLWAAAVLETRSFPNWIAWLGGALGVAGILALVTGAITTSVLQVGLFILGFSVWAVSAGCVMLKRPA